MGQQPIRMHNTQKKPVKNCTKTNLDKNSETAKGEPQYSEGPLYFILNILHQFLHLQKQLTIRKTNQNQSINPLFDRKQEKRTKD